MADDKDTEAIVFAQVDANLDTNPKVRKAGSFGRQVFEFILRRNALRGSKGHVPIALVDPDYLADLLMITRDDAVTGVTKSVTARLIEIDHVAGVVRIVGWHPSWGRRPMEGKERTAGWRERKKAKSPEPVTTGDGGDETSSRVTFGDESDAIEERRGDQRSGDTHAARARAIPPPPVQGYDPGNRQHVDAWVAWTFQSISAARLVVAQENAIQNVLPFPMRQNTPAESRGCRELRDRIREEGAGAPRVCLQVVEALTAEGRETKSVEWLSERAFTQGGWCHAREAVPGWRAARSPARTGGSALDVALRVAAGGEP